MTDSLDALLGRSFDRQCLYCGRRGTRMFVSAGMGLYRCKFNRSCERRRRRWNNRFFRGRR